MHDLLRKLRQPLPMEAQLAFGNTAVIGGLNHYMQSLLATALADAEWQDAEPLSRLRRLWREYEAADTLRREQIIAASQEILGQMELLERDPEPAPLQVAVPPAARAAKPRQPVASPGDGLETPVTFLKGVGPKKALLLAKLQVQTVHDLLYYFPARYEDRSHSKAIRQLNGGDKESFCCQVLYPAQTRQVGGRFGARQLTRVRVGDDTGGRLDLQWWNQPYREKQFTPGMRLYVYGKVTEYNGALQVDGPEFEILGEGDDALQAGRIVPIYPATEGVYQSWMRRAVMSALEKFSALAEEMLPAWVIERIGLAALPWSLWQIHFPSDDASRQLGTQRLIFEELFLLQVALAAKRNAAQTGEVGIAHVVDEETIKGFVRALPFKLTNAQKRVMNEVRRDLKSPRPMNRLLHGDVGAGKTVVACYALWTAHQTGHQAALLAPTEILAEQHYSVLSHLLQPLGIEVALLQGSLSGGQKKRVHADISEGRTSVIVGTHALIQEAVSFSRLGVCVVDEQHRFGVLQRAALQQKGYSEARPDVLVMTATPIPRTLALTIYGDLDVSVLDELPPGRQPIKTVNIKPNQRPRAYKFVLDEVKKGRQAYVVCPLVEESENLSQLKAATALAERLRAEELHGLRVGLLHGQMGVVEREAEMERFRAGMLDVLVSTTVIEVGVNVSNATVMVIEDADRFGLSQLHQLRGRVGRGEHKSTCVLMGDPKTDEGRTRLRVMTRTQDGFEIAEEDLRLRGPGEFYGTRQSGLPDLRIADIVRDVEVVQQARQAAAELVASDPQLQAPEHSVLVKALGRFWGDRLNLIRVS